MVEKGSAKIKKRLIEKRDREKTEKETEKL